MLAPAAHAEQRFRIVDSLGAPEIDEQITVFVDQQEVGTFRLGADRAAASLDVAVPDAPQHAYRLCGRLTLRTPEGDVAQREVNGSGTLTDVEGRVYTAMTADWRHLFFLADATPGRPTAPVRIGQGGCAPVVSMR